MVSIPVGHGAVQLSLLTIDVESALTTTSEGVVELHDIINIDAIRIKIVFFMTINI
jgi:hypothetical protein